MVKPMSLRQRLDAGLAGDDPLQEVLGGLLIGVGSLGVNAPVVLGTGGQTLVLLALDADVDRHHADGIGLHAGLLQIGPCPSAVLIEHGLAEGELGGGVVTGLGAQLGRLGGGILQIQVEDVLILRQIGALDGLRLLGDVVILELIVKRQVGQMGLETPVGAGIETGGGERALDTKLVLLSLDVISHGLQGIEVVDVIDALDLGAVGGDVLGQQILVVDQAISLHGVRNTDDLIPILEGDILVDELLVRLSVGHVISVGLPVLVADRTVDLEQGRGLGLGDLGLQSLLVCAGSSGLDLDLNTSFLGVILGQLLPFVIGFRLEVQVSTPCPCRRRSLSSNYRKRPTCQRTSPR